MKNSELKAGYYRFGNKGACWTNTVHIAKYGSTTLCGVPMLSTNWAEHWNEDVGCTTCIEKHNNNEDHN